MMRTKLISLFAVAGLLAACSSKPAETKTEAAAPWDKEVSRPAPAPAPVAKPAPAPAAPAPAAPKEPSDELGAALKSGDDTQIQRAAQTYLMQVPNDVRSLNALAMVQYKKGRFDFAAYLLGRAIAADGQRSELYSNLGLVELAKHNRRSAVQNFRRAIELDANDTVAAANLGAIYVQEKDYIKAAVVLEMAAKKGSKDLKVLNNYGVALAHAGHPEQAYELYQTALKDQPHQKEVLLNASIVLIDQLNKPKEGLDLLNRLKFLGVPPEAKTRIIALENKAKAGVK